MSEGVLFYFHKDSETLNIKVDIKDALYKSRKILSESNGISMKNLNDRPFLKFFKRPKKYSLIVKRKIASNFSKKEPRNTFATK